MDNKQDRITIRKRGEDGYRVFSVRILESTVTRIDEIAAESGRSRNEIIGILLNFAVDRCDII